MNISQTHCESLQRARGTWPAVPIATRMDTLFPAHLTAQQQTPLIKTATKLFREHWTGAAGMRSSSWPTILELVTRMCTEWKVEMRREEASISHAANLQAHVAALEEYLSNSTKEKPASGPAGG